MVKVHKVIGVAGVEHLLAIIVILSDFFCTVGEILSYIC